MLGQVAYEEWTQRHGDAACLQSKERLLDMDVGVMRERLERELHIARRSIALDRLLCRDFGGTSEGELLDAGTNLVPSGCDTCSGEGWLVQPPQDAPTSTSSRRQ